MMTMNDGVILRPARRVDAAAVAAVHVETWRDTYAGIIPDAYLIDMNPAVHSERWKGHIRDPGSGLGVGHGAGQGADQGSASRDRVVVAEADVGVVGFVSFGPTRFPKLAFEVEVYALYVAVDWQNRGLGRRLMAAAFDTAVTEGLRGVVVWVLAENPSRFFYQTLGGRAVGQRSEAFAGTMLKEQAYGWGDLRGCLAAWS